MSRKSRNFYMRKRHSVIIKKTVKIATIATFVMVDRNEKKSGYGTIKSANTDSRPNTTRLSNLTKLTLLLAYYNYRSKPS